MTPASEIALLVTGRDGRDVFGTLKGADFVHFYTLGRLALDRRGDLLYDGPGQHDVQVALATTARSTCGNCGTISQRNRRKLYTYELS